ncbi:MAG: hypothetical protein IPM29_27440 [Planctomycetes bacterium]|nr:hypothetical protein [Planctomycetota bacterium]
MTKLWIGLLLFLLAIGSCLGAPVLGLIEKGQEGVLAELEKALPTVVATRAADSAEPFELGEADFHGVGIVARDSGGEHPTEGVPRDGFAFVNDAGGRIEVVASGDGSASGTHDGLSYELIGLAQVKPGRYHLDHPALPDQVQLVVLRLDIPSLLANSMIGFGLSLLLGFAGVILVILGIADGRRRRREELYED